MSESIEARAVLNDNENIKKFRELQQYLEDEIPDHVTEKTGQAATVRLAIRMAHNHMDVNQQELEEGHSHVEDVRTRMSKEANNL